MNERFYISDELKRVELNRKVAVELLKYVIVNQSEPTITYGKLASKIDRDFNPRNLDKPLGVVSSVCIENNLPPVSGVVINKEFKLPGEGFYKEFFSGRKMNEWEEIYKNNILEIKTCNLWKDFLIAIESWKSNTT